MNSKDKKFQIKISNQNGAVIVLVAVLTFVLLGIAAFAIDFGYRHVVRNELQNAADSSALAAARELGKIYENMNPASQATYVCDPGDIVPIAKQAAANNYAGDKKQLIVNDADVLIGQWPQWQKLAVGSRTNNFNQPDAVMVTVRRQQGANGPISTFFAPIFGVETLGISATATAALTGQGTVAEGGLPIPVGIGKAWFNPANWASEGKGFCDQDIKMYPTGGLAGCAGWHVYDEPVNQANANYLAGIINQLNPWCDPNSQYFDDKICKKNQGQYDPSDPYQSPESSAGDSFIFTGGTVASALPNMEFLYDAKKDANGIWLVDVVVYDIDSCGSQPSGSVKIAGFASAEIYGIETAQNGSKTINARVKCELVQPGRGGGEDFGTKGSIPGLVE